MKKYLKVLLNGVLGMLTVVSIFLLNFIVFVLIFDFSKGLEKILIAVVSILLSLLLAFILRKKKLYSISVLVISVIVSWFLFYKSFKDIKPVKQNGWMVYTTEWENENHTTGIPFFVHPNGLIYIKVKVNAEEKYLLFDTGAFATTLHEKYNTSKLIDTITATSSQDRKGRIAIHKLDSLSFGSLSFKKLPYASMKKETWEACGVFHNQNSIAGVLGNNIINNFVWDFNMVKRTVEVKDIPLSDTISNFKIVPLKRDGMSWNIEIKLNGQKKTITLDSGSTFIISVKDSIELAKSYVYPIVNAEKSKGIFSYFDCNGNEIKIDSNRIKTKRQTRKVFANLKIADTTFRDTFVRDKSTSNLLGIPLFWEYERVVLDFLYKRMYLVNPVKKSNRYTLSMQSRVTLWKLKIEAISQSGYYEMYFENPIVIKTKSKSTQDTLIFNFIGHTKVFASIKVNKKDKYKEVVIDSVSGNGYILNNNSKDSINSGQIKLNTHKNAFLKNQNFMNEL